MAFRIETAGRARTVAGLVKSLVGEKVPPEALDRAKEALLQANPRIEKDGFTPGMQIIVPRFEVASEGRAETAAVDAAPVDAGLVRASAEALLARMTSHVEAQLAEAKETVGLLRAKKTQDAILAVRPDLKDRLEDLGKEVEAKGKRLRAVGQDLGTRLSGLARRSPESEPRRDVGAKKD